MGEKTTFKGLLLDVAYDSDFSISLSATLEVYPQFTAKLIFSIFGSFSVTATGLEYTLAGAMLAGEKWGGSPFGFAGIEFEEVTVFITGEVEGRGHRRCFNRLGAAV